MTAMPEAYRTIVDPLIVTARQILERGWSLVPLAFVGNVTTKAIHRLCSRLAARTRRRLGLSDPPPCLAARGRLRLRDMDAWLLLPEKVRRYGEIIVPCGSIGAGSYRRWRICAGAQLEAALGVTLGRYNQG